MRVPSALQIPRVLNSETAKYADRRKSRRNGALGGFGRSAGEISGLASAVAAVVFLILCAPESILWSVRGVECCPWPAVDALGRVVPTTESTGAPKKDRFVGIFYFVWHEHANTKRHNGDGPYDVSKILAADPDALDKPDSPLWGPIGAYHYWAEPLFGYYQSDDPWVLRRHVMMLSDAGIDVLIIDATNALTYRDKYEALCAVMQKVRATGGQTPQIAFMLNTHARQTARKLFDDLYKPGRYRESWFFWQGKPLMICDPEQVEPELREFFTLRRAHWPFEMVNTRNAWHWEATYPQPYGYTNDPAVPEQVNVSVAQNLSQADGKVTNMSSGQARGRSFHDGRQDTSKDAVLWGHNFNEQWRRAFDLAPPFVMVTGWNEWIAGRWGQPGGPIVFVDQYDQEFSRDIEPMKNGHADNYYYQLVANVRKFKGTPPIPQASPPVRIAISAGFEQWAGIEPVYKDHVGETEPRDHAGAAGLQYVNRTGRNDIVFAQVARDDANIYFRVHTREPVSPPNNKNWMWLLIDTDHNKSTGWEGYDFIVNRTIEPGATWLERNTGAWNWTRIQKLPFRVDGPDLHIAIPRAAIGLADRTSGVTIDFKWVDNSQRPGEIMDFYLGGDVAPEGRFAFRYSF